MRSKRCAVQNQGITLRVDAGVLESMLKMTVDVDCMQLNTAQL